MKAHEQQWEQDAVESRSVVTHDGYRVAEVYPASAFGSYAEQREIARLISAAPDMARALISLMECTDFVGEPWYEAARAALKKAGVL